MKYNTRFFVPKAWLTDTLYSTNNTTFHGLWKAHITYIFAESVYRIFGEGNKMRKRKTKQKKKLYDNAYLLLARTRRVHTKNPYIIWEEVYLRFMLIIHTIRI